MKFLGGERGWKDEVLSSFSRESFLRAAPRNCNPRLLVRGRPRLQLRMSLAAPAVFHKTGMPEVFRRRKSLEIGILPSPDRGITAAAR